MYFCFVCVQARYQTRLLFSVYCSNCILFAAFTAQKECNLLLGISSVNVTKSTGNCGISHIYYRNPLWKTSFFVLCVFNTRWSKGALKRLLRNMQDSLQVAGSRGRPFLLLKKSQFSNDICFERIQINIGIIILVEQHRIIHLWCFLKKGVLKNFSKFKGKHLCQSFMSATFLKKWLRNSCFPVNLWSRTPPVAASVPSDFKSSSE